MLYFGVHLYSSSNLKLQLFQKALLILALNILSFKKSKGCINGLIHLNLKRMKNAHGSLMKIITKNMAMSFLNYLVLIALIIISIL